MDRRVVLGVVLLALAGVSVYLWTSDKEQTVDTALASDTEHYICPSCQHEFDLTNAESTAMFRAGGIKCPACREVGDSTMKADVEVYMGGFGSRGGSDEDEGDEGDEPEEEEKPTSVGGRTPVRP